MMTKPLITSSKVATMSKNYHLKRTEVVQKKGQVDLSSADKETVAQNNIPDELNNLLSVILSKKYIGGYNDENA